MRVIFRTCALLALAFALVPQDAWAADLDGIWLTSGGRSRVEMKACEDQMCANIIWLKDPYNAQGEPLHDRRNEAAELRDRPIIGILVLKVAPAGDNYWEGRVYDPERGKTYPAKVSLLNEDTLKVTGCSWTGIICKSKTWSRVNVPVDGPIQAAPAAPPPPSAPRPVATQKQAPPPSAPRPVATQRQAPPKQYSDPALKPYFPNR